MSEKIKNGGRELVDTETGETVRTIEVIPEVREKGWGKVYQTMSRKVLKDLKASLNGATDVLWYFIDRLIAAEPFNSNPEMYAHTDQIAEATGQSGPTIRRHIKMLIEHKYLIRIRIHLYKINPDFIFVGYAKRRVKAQQEFGELVKEAETEEPSAGKGPVSRKYTLKLAKPLQPKAA